MPGQQAHDHRCPSKKKSSVWWPFTRSCQHHLARRESEWLQNDLLAQPMGSLWMERSLGMMRVRSGNCILKWLMHCKWKTKTMVASGWSGRILSGTMPWFTSPFSRCLHRSQKINENALPYIIWRFKCQVSFAMHEPSIASSLGSESMWLLSS